MPSAASFRANVGSNKLTLSGSPGTIENQSSASYRSGGLKGPGPRKTRKDRQAKRDSVQFVKSIG